MSKPDVTKGLVRYMRASTLTRVGEDEVTLAPHNMGGITFAVNIRHSAKKLDVAIAICRADENFSKKVGRNAALTLLEQGGHNVITVDYEPKVPLLNNMIHGVMNYQPVEITEVDAHRLRTAKRAIAAIIRDTEAAIDEYKLEFMSMFGAIGDHITDMSKIMVRKMIGVDLEQPSKLG
jgi:hypothetical protein